MDSHIKIDAREASDLFSYSPNGFGMRRSSFVIVAEILELARKETCKTKIMYGANLSCAQVKHYISYLVDMELLKSTQASNPLYKTTTKGLLYLRRFRELMEFMKPIKLNNPKEADSLKLIENRSKITVAW